jgi:hypothetical protein
VTYVDYFTLGRSLLLALAIAALVLDFWQVRRRRAFFHVERFLVVLAILSVWAFTGFGRFHGGGHVHIHAGEMYHYYLSSKYFSELGYDGLYGATLSARPEDPHGCLRDVRRARDLRTAEMVPATSLRADPSYRERFSPERWEAFRADLAFFLSRCSPKNWKKYLSDHGYNAPPWRTIITAPIANALGPAKRTTLLVITFLDYILLVAAVVVIGRSYDLRTAALATVLLGCNTLASFDWTGGSFLRQDWLALCIFGVCALKSRRHVLAGAMLGAAALLRIFPAFFAIGYLAQGGLAFLRTRRWEPARTRFATGLAASLLAMLVPSLIFLGGPDSWQAFYVKISLHLGPVAYGNHVGLRAILGDAPVVQRVAQLVIAGAYLASLPRLTASQAAVFGGFLVYAFGFIASYYYGFLVLYLLWDARGATDLEGLVRSSLLLAIPIVAGVLILWSPERIALYDPRVYAATSGALLVFFAVLTLEIWRRPAAREATSRSVSGE